MKIENYSTLYPKLPIEIILFFGRNKNKNQTLMNFLTY